MSRIQQLDPHVVNRIAAGEVIERPASVVKELLENSVDALSTRIEVDIVDGGMQLIRVSDNGEGIHPDDMLLAVTSHATSKIRSDADLSHVSSLGFRGEALASIASVSRFRIRTRLEDQSVGTELESQGGQITVHRECGCPCGTQMEVHNLFFNTPARRRFLRKASTEFGHVSECFARIALANPALHLVLRHNDRQVFELPATTQALERIRRFFGSDIADQLISVRTEAELTDQQMIRIWGYVGAPTLSKSTRKSQYLFLNGRCIQDRSLQHALEEAYRGLLMVGRHPVSFLFLELPPAIVDVNVHPTKSEVRFQDSQLIYRLLLQMLRDRFLQLEFRSQLDVAEQQSRQAVKLTPTPAPVRPARELDLWAERAPAVPSVFSDRSVTRPDHPPFTSPSTDSPDPHPSSVFDRPPASERSPLPQSAPAAPRSDSGQLVSATPEHLPVPGWDEQHEDHGAAESTPDSESAAAPADDGHARKPVVLRDEFRAFQIHDCYLVVASDEGLEVIDQHALHERILYEHLRHRVLGNSVERQRLLIPLPVECSATEAAVLIEYQELLKESGFEIEDFGGTTILLTACPVLLPRGDLADTLRDLAGMLEQTDGHTSRRDLLDRMLHTMACRAAIKSGQRLTQEEMRELLRQRHLVDDSHHCPHGRPTSLTLSRGTLDQQFGRLG